MKCPKCGSEVKPNYKFCSKCGQPMTAEGSAPVSKPQVEATTSSGPQEKLFGIHFGRNRNEERERKPQRQQGGNHSSDQKEDDGKHQSFGYTIPTLSGSDGRTT